MSDSGIGHHEAAARKQGGKRDAAAAARFHSLVSACSHPLTAADLKGHGKFGAVTHASACRGAEGTPQQCPPVLSEQEFPSLEGSKRPITSPQGAWSPATISQPKSADPESVGSEPMNLTTFKRPRLEQPGQLCPTPGHMCSDVRVPISETLKDGFGELNLLDGGLREAKGKGKAPSYQSQDGVGSRSALTPTALPFTPASQRDIKSYVSTIGRDSFSSTFTPFTRHHAPLNFRNQTPFPPFYFGSMTSSPTPDTSRPAPNYGSSSLPNTQTAGPDERDLAIFQNATLVAGAQREHEEQVGGLYGQNLGISSTNPDGHFVCGRALQDLKIRNAALKTEVQEVKARQEELKHENDAMKGHCSTMETTLLSVGTQQAISLGDFTNMMNEMVHLRAIAEHAEPMVETVNGYQQEIAILRARLLANGIDPSITTTPVVPPPQEPMTAPAGAIQEAPVSRPVITVPGPVELEEDNGRFPSNKFFFGEFGILFRSIANLGRCNYQFTKQMPVTTVQIPPQIREELKVIVQGKERLLDWLLDDTNKTKFLLVSGLFSRLIYGGVMVENFVDQLILKTGEAPSEKTGILEGWARKNPDIINKVWPVLTEMSEALAGQLHDKYVSLLSRPTDARHLEESLRSLVGCIEHAGRLAIGMAYLGWGNWRFVFHGTETPFQSAKMTVCDLGTEGLLNFGHDTSVLEEKKAKIKFCVFPMVYRRDNTGAWKVLSKATALV
ncbi:hypothetical protein C7212DRAFT_361033 [Tuber magnatum]|uniref:Uncharacterized protein n=1 Tax=Tuber magnatum TaxID=42249 RepID=A0A317T145_9PEZI|nr:hypothetical protein C7212DRAFT_361033 [Tuber magnatum]